MLKKGDYVGFIYGQPGNDTDYCVVTTIHDDNTIEIVSPFYNVKEVVSEARLFKLKKNILFSRIMTKDDYPRRIKDILDDCALREIPGHVISPEEVIDWCAMVTVQNDCVAGGEEVLSMEEIYQAFKHRMWKDNELA